MDQGRKKTTSDEEDDLEALRLVALKSLKKPAVNPSCSQTVKISNTIMHGSEVNYKFRAASRNYGNYPYKRGRFMGRGPSNGNRVISSNLISLTPCDSLEGTTSKQCKNDSVFLPQARHNSHGQQEEKGDEASSKFDRYRDTDKSEDEDSEEEVLKIESDEEPCKLERADSLEALMQELDDEIQGIAKPKEMDEKSALVDTKSEEQIDSTKTEAENKIEKLAKPDTLPALEDKLIDEGDVPTSDQVEKSMVITDNSDSKTFIDRSANVEPQLKKRRHSPPTQRGFRSSRGKLRGYKQAPHSFNRQYLPQNGGLHHFPPNMASLFSNPPPFGPPPMIVNAPPPFFERPLLIDTTQNLHTQAMAPLSPRSAAFVLQNRAIIEKRKRSPRRSYSRSPSPRNRSRSISPRIAVTSPRRRSVSPRKRSMSPRRRSLSPRKSPLRNRSPPPLRKSSPVLLRKRSPSPLRKRSRSPRRRSISPKRRSVSPKRRPFSPKQKILSPKLRSFSPKRRSVSPRKRSISPRKRETKDSENGAKNKISIRDRLGFKSSSKSDEKTTREKSNADRSTQKDVKPIDPILEARKKKFESKEIKVREGVIRLKPKDELKAEEKMENNIVKVESSNEVEHVISVKKSEDVKEEVDIEPLNEEIILQDDALELEAHLDLFSEEESDHEVEGRFKAKEASIEVCGTLPFSKLINGEKRESKTIHIEDSRKKSLKTASRNLRDESSGLQKRHDTSLADSARKSRTRQTSKADKSGTSKKLGVKSERHPKKFDRKIEIKIKNPSKYERADKIDAPKEIKLEKHRKLRKVEMGTVVRQQETNGDDDDDDDDTEIIMDNDDESENPTTDEGDLRAQLSKKRAEKLNKHTSHKGLTSRLLQNALENALPIKKHKKSKSKELSSSELAAIKSLFTADFIASRLRLTVPPNRHVTVYKNKTFKFGFKSSAPVADGKLPIHLRLGLACGPDILTKTKRKSKKKEK